MLVQNWFDHLVIRILEFLDRDNNLPVGSRVFHQTRSAIFHYCSLSILNLFAQVPNKQRLEHYDPIRLRIFPNR